MRELRLSRFQAIVLLVGVLYMLVVVLATVYSQTIYIEKLPVVVLASLSETASGRIREDMLEEVEDGSWLVNTVERVDGPWGSKYIIKQVTSHLAQPMPSGWMYVMELDNSTNPVVAASSQPLTTGMEVRVVSEITSGIGPQ